MSTRTRRHFPCSVIWLLFLLGLTWQGVVDARSGDTTLERDGTLEAALTANTVLAIADPKQALANLEAMSGQFTTKDIPPATRLRFLSMMSSAYLASANLERAKEFNAKALDLADNRQSADLSAEALAGKIDILRFENDRKAMLETAEQLIPYLANTQHWRALTIGHTAVAEAYQSFDQFERALENYQRALDVISHIREPYAEHRRFELKQKIANLHISLKNWPVALAMLDESIKEAQQNQLLKFLPRLYILRGYVLIYQGRYGEAANNYEQGLPWALKAGDAKSQLTLLNNLGDAHMRLNNLKLASQYLQEARELAIKLKDTRIEKIIRFNLGFVEVKSGLHRQGLDSMINSLNYFRENDSQSETELLLEELADAYRVAGMFKEESDALREQREIRAALFQTERDEQLNQMQQQFEAKEKARQILLLQQENALKSGQIERDELRQRIAMLVIVVGVLTAIMIWQLYRKARQSNLRLQEANAMLAYQSTRDPLTGLFNRRLFQEQMQFRTRDRERRQQDRTHVDGLILLDVDHFKHINDRFGHAAGDEVLIEVGKRLMNASRNDDMVVRWGGEEFLILMRNVDNSTLSMLCQRVLDAVGGTPIPYEQQGIPVTVSAGFLTLPFADLDEQEFDWEKAMRLADMALYLSKVHGRNRAYGLLHLKAPYAQIHHTLETELSRAIDADWVEVTKLTGPLQQAAVNAG